MDRSRPRLRRKEHRRGRRCHTCMDGLEIVVSWLCLCGTAAPGCVFLSISEVVAGSKSIVLSGKVNNVFQGQLSSVPPVDEVANSSRGTAICITLFEDREFLDQPSILD